MFYDDNCIGNLKHQFERFGANSCLWMEETLNFINNEYHEKDILFSCLKFIDSLTTAFSSNSKDGVVVTFFSSLVCKEELTNSLNLTSLGIYHSAFDSLRRAIEITLAGFYFDLIKGNQFFIEDDVLKSELFDWYYSLKETPRMRDIKNRLSEHKKFRDNSWVICEAHKLFGSLSNYSHSNGINYSVLNFINRKGDFGISTFSKENLHLFLENYIKTSKQIAVLYAFFNPILICGLPVFEKFGFSGGLGLFEKKQSQVLLNLIHEDYKKKLFEIVNQNNSIQDRIKKVEAMPISDEYKKMQSYFPEN
ncbi:MAG TPA: hypothetical protein DER09_12775 [Prolixibacteraceae bacterium]|nr:hypothetical protein [Prolixibacteraceae bacterium]